MPFYTAGGEQRADVIRLISAIETLTDRGVRVIYLSLAGPPNLTIS
jgi:hypothetical protein